MLRWRPFSECCKARISIGLDHEGGHYIENERWHTNVNTLHSTVAHLNATINVKPETLNWRLGPTGLTKPGETRWLTGTCPSLARQESVDWVFGWVSNWTDLSLRSKPGLLAGYPELLLTLRRILRICQILSTLAGNRLNASSAKRNYATRTNWKLTINNISQYEWMKG